MATIGLLFGSFDPVHNGHLQIARWALREGCEEVWLVVQPDNAYKKGTPLASHEHRTVMAALATADKPGISVVAADDQADPAHIVTSTIYGMPKHHKVHLILGQDLADNISSWPDHLLLLDRCQLLIHPRFDNISSSQIRQRAATSQPVDELLPADVQEYIQVNQLYR